MTATYTFTIQGMHCASCAILIDDTVEDLPGVHRCQTSLRAGRTAVDADPTRVNPHTIAAAITAAGYQARLDNT